MPRFVEGQDRQQVTLLPECLDDFIAEDNTVRIVDVFIDELDLVALGFEGANPAKTGRPAYHPAVLLKLYLYGYLNRIQSSRRLERECQRNVELMWLTGRLAPDFKTIADFRRDNGNGIRNVCRRFVVLCRELKLFTDAVVAIDGSKFKAVNNRERNYTPGKIERRERELEESIQRYLDALETADRTQPVEMQAKVERLQGKVQKMQQGLSIATGVSSACSTRWRSSSSASASTSGCSCTPHSPTHCASVERAMAWPARAKIASWRYSGRWSRNLATSTWASKPGVGRPLSMTFASTGAWVSTSQQRHTHLPRMWRSTVNTLGW